ncbi:hypothetical protein FB565_002965 [Actinoplanes lutulentus]|uniref:Pentapeptide repeat protein n=1 Tax=Actinoplanes lutulentus TaxID=1287878 RepID=A0A327Z2S3_9ACTN|nr:pentapeptide repeat-containing protein [Actinoplanes lutulentus]MBB2943252.1 hypothetical protein [Actinoplanes lutulentus]RAK28313.1 pentapeptide repeat protein [Actinoplanes lutulentus]
MWIIANGAASAEQPSLHISSVKYGLGCFAAAAAVAALLLNFRRQLVTEYAHDLELRKQSHVEADAAERRVTELYVKAVEQLGHADGVVRLGGLYALERVAQKNVDQRQTVVDVICGYLRMPYEPPASRYSSDEEKQMLSKASADPADGAAMGGGRDERQELQVRVTAQRILRNHLRIPEGGNVDDLIRRGGSPDRAFWPDIDVDLSEATLLGFDFRSCVVRVAKFGRASFYGSVGFGEATFLEDVQFGSAEFLGDAYFSGATFRKDAYFGRASFHRSATFGEVEFLAHAMFGAVRFSGDAMFHSSVFTAAAWFTRATFGDFTIFSHARFLNGCTFIESVFRGETYFGTVMFSGDDVSFAKSAFDGDVRFDNSRVVNRSDSQDCWPAGWDLVPGADFASLVERKPDEEV